MISPLPGEADDISNDADNLGNIVHQTQLDMSVKLATDDTVIHSDKQSDSEVSQGPCSDLTYKRQQRIATYTHFAKFRDHIEDVGRTSGSS